MITYLYSARYNSPSAPLVVDLTLANNFVPPVLQAIEDQALVDKDAEIFVQLGVTLHDTGGQVRQTNLCVQRNSTRGTCTTTYTL